MTIKFTFYKCLLIDYATELYSEDEEGGDMTIRYILKEAVKGDKARSIPGRSYWEVFL